MVVDDTGTVEKILPINVEALVLESDFRCELAGGITQFHVIGAAHHGVLDSLLEADVVVEGDLWFLS